MEQPDTRPAIAAAVIVYKGSLLLVQRRVKEGSLSWQFPAGEVEPGESGEQAAVRETEEETGLIVEAKEFLGERVHPATGRTMLYVACHVVGGAAYVNDQDEIAAIAWVTPPSVTDLIPYPFYGPVQEYLDAAMAA